MSENLILKGQVAFDTSDAERALARVEGGAGKMAQAVQKAGQQAQQGVNGIGNGAPQAAQKIDAATRSFENSLQRAVAAFKAGEKGSADFYAALSNARGIDSAPIRAHIEELRKLEAAQKAAREAAAQAAKADSFVAGLKAQADAIGKTRSQLLEIQAAELGISASVAPYIKKLKEAEQGQNNLGMSAKATAAALRQVPAQFTDIVTQLSGGQSPMQVLIQQGGQLKDTFGGVGPAASALGGYIKGLINPFTVTAAAAAVLGLELAHAESQLRQLKSVQAPLEGTGRGGLFSTAEIKDFIAELSKAPGVTRDVAAQIVSEFAKAHDIGGGLFKDLSRLAADYARATVTDIPTAAKTLAKAFSDPAQGAKTLEDALGSLTSSQTLTIERLERLGDRAGAQKVLLESLEAAVKGVADRAMTPLQKATNDLGNAWDRANDSMSHSDGLRSINELLAKAVGYVSFLVNNADKIGGLGTIGALSIPGLAPGALGSAAGAGVRSLFESTPPKNPTASGKVGGIPGAAAPAAASDDEIKRALEAAKAYRSQAQEIRELTERRTAFNKALTESITLYGKDSEQSKRLRDAVVGVNEQIAKIKGQGANEVADLKAQRREVDQEIAQLLADQERLLTGDTRSEKQVEAEKRLLKLQEEKKVATNAVVRAEKEQAIVEAQALVDRERLKEQTARVNAELRETTATRTKNIESIKDEASKIREAAIAQEAANASTGKSKTAIEQETLAHYKSAAALAKLDPERHAAMLQRIADQERYVKALQEGEFIQESRKLDESIRASKEETQTLQLEVTLLGRSQEEREKILAQRKVEVELAKELAAIDKLNLGGGDAADRRREQLKDKAREDARIKSENAAQKSVLDDWQRTADSINNSLTDALLRGFESGKGFAHNLRDTLKNMFQTLVLRPIIQAVLAPVSGTLAGIGQQIGGSITGGGGSGVGGALGGIGNVAGLAGLFGAGGLGGSILAGAGWLTGATTFTGALGAAGSLIGTGTAGGILSGLGMGVGALGPIALGIAGIAALTGAFKHGGPKLEGVAGPGMDWFNAPNSSGDSAAEQLRKGLQTQYDALAKALGADAGVQFGVGFVRDPKGTAQSSLGVTANRGSAILADEFSSQVGRSDEEFQQAFAAYANRVMLRALQAANISGPVGTYLQSLGDLATAEADKVQEALTRVQKIAAERAALDEQLYVLTHTAQEKVIRDRQRERDALDELNRALYDHVTALGDLKAQEASLRDQLVGAYQSEADALRGVIERHSGFAKQLRELRDSLLLQAESPLTRRARTAFAGSRFDGTLSSAVAGNEDALQALGGTGTDLLEAAKASARTPAELATAFAKVMAGLTTAAASADGRVSTAQQQLDAMTQQLTALGILNNTVKDVGSLLGSLLEVQNKITQEQLKYAAAQAAQTVPTASATPTTTAAQETEAQIRARLLPAFTTTTPDRYTFSGDNDTPTLIPGGTTVDEAGLAAAIQAELARRLAAVPAFALGGLASGVAMLGERGPEVADFQTPGRVYTNEQTRGMFASQSAQVDVLREVSRKLDVVIDSTRRGDVAQLQQLSNIADKVKKWDIDGQPPVRG